MLITVYAFSNNDRLLCSDRVEALHNGGFTPVLKVGPHGRVILIDDAHYERLQNFQRQYPHRYGSPDKNLARLGNGWELDARGYRYTRSDGSYLIVARAPTPSNKNGWTVSNFGADDLATHGNWYPSLKKVIASLVEQTEREPVAWPVEC